MELMTYMEGQDAWVSYPGIFQGLRVSRFSSGKVLLVCTSPADEIGDVVALIAVFKAICGSCDRLSVASRWPSLEWTQAVRAEGITRVYLVDARPESDPHRVSRESLLEVPEDLCPALHIRLFNGSPASVCGNRFDQLVLGRRQFAQACFARWRQCPWAVQAATLAPSAVLAAGASR
jgi:hypothetical protein